MASITRSPPSAILLVIAVSNGVLVAPAIPATADGGAAVAPTPPVFPVPPERKESTAAEIVERARAAERWITGVESFLVRAETRWSKSEESIAHQRKELERQYGRNAVPADHPNLAPEPRSSLLIAFDMGRLYARHESSSGYVDARLWDGAMAYSTQGTVNGPISSVALGDHPSFAGRDVLTDLPWLRTDSFALWFLDQARPNVPMRRADQFTLVGREEFRGVECHVLEVEGGFHRWYVDVENGRLRGMSQRVLRRDSNTVLRLAPIAERRGATVRTWKEWHEWTRGLSTEERSGVARVLDRHPAPVAADGRDVVHGLRRGGAGTVDAPHAGLGRVAGRCAGRGV